MKKKRSNISSLRSKLAYKTIRIGDRLERLKAKQKDITIKKNQSEKEYFEASKALASTFPHKKKKRVVKKK